MSRYGDLDDGIAKLQAMKQLFESITDDSVDIFISNKLINFAIRALNNCATVDVEPVRHAHWIENEDYSLTCSACGHTTDEIVKEAIGDGVYDVLDPYFCAKCGARMDEV